MRNTSASGFTLIELVAVIVILGIVAAVAVPNFLSVSSSAHRAIVAQTASAFQTAVTQGRIRYLVNRLSGVQDNVPGFANGGGDFNANGFPVDAVNTSGAQALNGTAANTVANNNAGLIQCRRVFEGILAVRPPICGGTGGTGVACAATHTWQAQTFAPAGNCRYLYRRDTSVTRRFDYNVLTGLVAVTNP